MEENCNINDGMWPQCTCQKWANMQGKMDNTI